MASYKNSFLFCLVLAVLIAAGTGILYVLNLLSKANMIQVWTKSGWVLLIVFLTMAIIGAIKSRAE